MDCSQDDDSNGDDVKVLAPTAGWTAVRTTTAPVTTSKCSRPQLDGQDDDSTGDDVKVLAPKA